MPVVLGIEKACVVVVLTIAHPVNHKATARVKLGFREIDKIEGKNHRILSRPR